MAYRIAEFLGSPQGHGRQVAGFLYRLTVTVLPGDNDAHATNLATRGVPATALSAQLAWNLERLQSHTRQLLIRPLTW
jgi:hypothetical protein